jgi:hypothetical protein
VPRMCFIEHKAEVGRDMTASTTKAILNSPHPGIVRFMQVEVGYRLQCGMSILVGPLIVVSFMRGKAESGLEWTRRHVATASP